MAIKTTWPTSETKRKRFDRERRTLARLHHTNIVQIFTTGSEGLALLHHAVYRWGIAQQIIEKARLHETSNAGQSSIIDSSCFASAEAPEPGRFQPSDRCRFHANLAPLTHHVNSTGSSIAG